MIDLKDFMPAINDDANSENPEPVAERVDTERLDRPALTSVQNVAVLYNTIDTNLATSMTWTGQWKPNHSGYGRNAGVVADAWPAARQSLVRYARQG
jgi:hypothetical protein